MKDWINKIIVRIKAKIYKKIIVLYCMFSTRFATKFLYKKVFKKELNLNNPTDFNEKLQWLKLYNFNDLIIKCADKYEVRDYALNKVGPQILCKIYGVYEDVNQIKFDSLPNRFALKCTHGCGYNIICSDKSQLDIEKTKKILNKWMKQKFGYVQCEPHYNNIKPRIICEEYLEDDTYSTLVDYKLYCFNGVPRYTLVCFDRGKDTKKIFYDMNWNKVNYRKDNSNVKFEQPICFNEMVEYATLLSKDFKFVRVDFYNVNGKPILGELTFTPAGALSTDYTEEGERELGKLINLYK